jgi:hypothetical protein
MKRKVTILSIDGGGIRGIIPAVNLNYIEEGLQRKTGDNKVFLSDYCDMIAGTSTGGILACFYLLPENLPVKEAIWFYATYGKTIFKKRHYVSMKRGGRPQGSPLRVAHSSLANCFVIASHVYKAGALYLPACRVSPVGATLAVAHHRMSHMSVVACRTCPSLCTSSSQLIMYENKTI